jgi:hypothetical protein
MLAKNLGIFPNVSLVNKYVRIYWCIYASDNGALLPTRNQFYMLFQQLPKSSILLMCVGFNDDPPPPCFVG